MPIYNLDNEWDDFIVKNQSIIKHIEHILVRMSDEFKAQSIQAIKRVDDESNEVSFYKSLLTWKNTYSNGIGDFSEYLLFGNNWSIDINKVTSVYVNKIFKRNSTVFLNLSNIDSELNRLKMFYSAYLHLNYYIAFCNSELKDDPSIAEITFANLEILAFNALLKEKITLKKRCENYQETLIELNENHLKEKASLYDSNQLALKSSYEQIDTLKEELSTLNFEMKFRKEYFMSYCVLKIEIPELKVLFNILAPLNLLFYKETLDFTRFCWFFDVLKMRNSDDDKIIIDFRKGSITAKQFGKLLYFLKTRIFNENAGTSFDKWVSHNFVFKSSHQRVIEMNRFIRKYETKDQPNMDFFKKFTAMFNDK